mmetsp:Transcript_31723/g.98946  ORF Transcript_31723/g.98946 Transcript_31723/m.98946 type:complete len:382 (-) Transcript_31723:17-1162(-)
MVFWGRALSEEEQDAAVAQLQERLKDVEVPGRYPGSVADAADLRRFLAARDFDLAKAEAMVRAHVVWRNQTFPVARDATIDMLLATKRVGEILAWNSENEPVVLFDCSWGNMLSGGVSASQFFDAYLVFVEEILTEMQSRKSLRWNWLSIGGPPPTDLARQLSAIFEANYPELLHVAVIAPIPHRIKRIINTFLWFLPEKTKSKFAIASGSQEMCGFLQCKVEDLPEHLRDIEAYESGRKGNGMSMEVTTEEGHRQVVRYAQVGAGKATCIPLEVDANVESVAFTVTVEQPRLMPSIIMGEHDIRFKAILKLAQADGSCEEEAEEELAPDTLVTVSSPYEQDWPNKAGRVGSLRFELDNSHSRMTSKYVALTQLIRLRPSN